MDSSFCPYQLFANTDVSDNSADALCSYIVGRHTQSFSTPRQAKLSRLGLRSGLDVALFLSMVAILHLYLSEDMHATIQPSPR